METDLPIDLSAMSRVKAGGNFLGIDEGSMSASAIISTDDEDRSKDVMLAGGCDLSEYRLNPVVHWNHGETLAAAPEMQLPIGKSEGPAGNFSVEIQPHSVEATCYFSQKNRFAAQVFDLLAEKIIRAASIEWTPIDYEVRAAKEPFMERPGLLFKTWKLTAWSWVGIPDNPFALAKCLARNRLAGSPIEESLRQSLLAHAPRLKRHVRGWTQPQIQETVPMAADMLSIQFDGSKFTSETAETWLKKYGFKIDLAKSSNGFVSRQADANGSATEEMAFQGEEGVTAICKSEQQVITRPTLVKVTSGVNSPQDQLEPNNKAADAPDDSMNEEDEAEEPYGSQVLRAAHSATKDMMYACNKALPSMEEPEVKEYVQNLATDLEGKCTEMEGLHKSKYPDHEALSREADETEESLQKSLKAFLRGNKAGAYLLAGVAEDLRKAAKIKTLSASNRQLFSGHASRLAKMFREASKETTDPIEQRIGKLEGTMSRIAESIEKATPNRR